MFLQCRFDPDLPCAHRHTSATSSPRDVDKDRERKWILQNIQVAKWPSAHQLQSVPADWQTDRQTVRQTDRQVPVSTGNTTLIQPTGGATASSCWSHKLFVQAIVWFQATLIRQCINQSLCFLFAQWPSPECKKSRRGNQVRRRSTWAGTECWGSGWWSSGVLGRRLSSPASGGHRAVRQRERRYIYSTNALKDNFEVILLHYSYYVYLITWVTSYLRDNMLHSFNIRHLKTFTQVLFIWVTFTSSRVIF